MCDASSTTSPKANISALAQEALTRIAALYAVEKDIRGQLPDQRHARAGPLLAALPQWLHERLRELSRKSAMAGAIGYALKLWPDLIRYCDDGRVEMGNNAAERALRVVALGRKHYLVAGSDAGGARAAAIHSLIGTAKYKGIDPEAYLICPKCSGASPSIPSTASTSCCPGAWPAYPHRQRMDHACGSLSRTAKPGR